MVLLLKLGTQGKTNSCTRKWNGNHIEMQVYVTIIDEPRYKDKFRYMNKTLEGVHASIQRHMDFFTVGKANVDHEDILWNLANLSNNYTTKGIIFSLNSGEKEFEIRCHYDYLLE